MAWYYLFKNFGIKSWVQFAQVFGFPLRVGRYGAGATPDEKDVLLRAVRSIAQDAAAIIPDSMRIEFVNTNSTGNVQIFKGLTEYFDKQISKAVLGQAKHHGRRAACRHGERPRARPGGHRRVRRSTACGDTVPRSCAAFGRSESWSPAALSDHQDSPGEKEDVSKWIDNVVKVAAVVPDFAEVSVVRDKLGIPQPAQGAATIGASPVKTEEDAPGKGRHQ